MKEGGTKEGGEKVGFFELWRSPIFIAFVVGRVGSGEREMEGRGGVEGEAGGGASSGASLITLPSLSVSVTKNRSSSHPRGKNSSELRIKYRSSEEARGTCSSVQRVSEGPRAFAKSAIFSSKIWVYRKLPTDFSRAIFTHPRKIPSKTIRFGRGSLLMSAAIFSFLACMLTIFATSKKSFVKATVKTDSVSEFTQCSKTWGIASVDPVRGIAPFSRFCIMDFTESGFTLFLNTVSSKLPYSSKYFKI
jgi:hypothetical protein